MISCKGDNKQTISGLESLDLMKYGMPIKIKAPANSEIESTDLRLSLIHI